MLQEMAWQWGRVTQGTPPWHRVNTIVNMFVQRDCDVKQMRLLNRLPSEVR